MTVTLGNLAGLQGLSFTTSEVSGLFVQSFTLAGNVLNNTETIATLDATVTGADPFEPLQIVAVNSSSNTISANELLNGMPVATLDLNVLGFTPTAILVSGNTSNTVASLLNDGDESLVDPDIFALSLSPLAAGMNLSFSATGTFTGAPLCFLAGTRIATPTREVRVEDLRIGDLVITAEGAAKPIKWLGRRCLRRAIDSRPDTVAPIRIQCGAFADNMPHNDLLVSPDHAIFVDGKLICARQLVNGTTIRQALDWTAVDYYHVELEEHAILLAEGLPAESYIDTGNRGFFANSDAPLVLHPDLTGVKDHPTREGGSCAPFVWDEAGVRPVWQRLAERAALIGQPVPPRTLTTDRDVHLLTNQLSVKPVYSDGNRAIFVLPYDAKEVRLLSRAQSPTEARPWLDDRRRLGVRVKRIVLRGANEQREIPMDHPSLTKGWWGVEHDGQVMSRWTDGNAVVPLPKMAGNVMLEVHLAGEMLYVADGEPERHEEPRAA